MVSDIERKDFQEQEWDYSGQLYFMDMRKSIYEGNKQLTINFSTAPLINPLEDGNDLSIISRDISLTLGIDTWIQRISTNPDTPLICTFFSEDNLNPIALYIGDETKSGTPKFPYEVLYFKQ